MKVHELTSTYIVRSITAMLNAYQDNYYYDYRTAYDIDGYDSKDPTLAITRKPYNHYKSVDVLYIKRSELKKFTPQEIVSTYNRIHRKEFL